jgi:hypothetical protein
MVKVYIFQQENQELVALNLEVVAAFLLRN